MGWLDGLTGLAELAGWLGCLAELAALAGLAGWLDGLARLAGSAGQLGWLVVAFLRWLLRYMGSPTIGLSRNCAVVVFINTKLN